jgi:hypothetical protein
MAGFDGALALVLIDTSVAQDGSGYEPVAAQTSFETETSRNMLDGSIKGTKHAQSAYGRQESTASMEALMSFDDDTQDRLAVAMDDRTPVVLQYGIDLNDDYPETGLISSFEKIYEAEALVSSVSKSFPDNENSTLSVEFTLNGPWVLQ